MMVGFCQGGRRSLFVELEWWKEKRMVGFCEGERHSLLVERRCGGKYKLFTSWVGVCDGSSTDVRRITMLCI